MGAIPLSPEHRKGHDVDATGRPRRVANDTSSDVEEIAPLPLLDICDVQSDFPDSLQIRSLDTEKP